MHAFANRNRARSYITSTDQASCVLVSAVRHRSLASSLLLVACSIVAAACTNGAHGGVHSTPSVKSSLTSTSPQDRAVAACRATAQRPSAGLPIGPETCLSAQATTVAAVRRYRFLGRERTLANAFPTAKPRAFAAWCWSRNGPTTYASYVVGPDGSKVVVGAQSSTTPPRPGAPTLSD